MPPKELCSRIHVCVSIWTPTQMTHHLFLLILSILAVSSQLGLDDVFFSPQDQTVREGEGVFFQCVSGDSSPTATITWLKDGALVTRGRQNQGEYGGGNQKKTSGTLHLPSAMLEDDGTYICVTHNPLLNINKRSQPAKLTVEGVLKRLQIINAPDNITVAIGTEVSMRCTVHGFPVPMVQWYKDSCLLKNCSTSFSLHNNGQLLTFRNVTKVDEGFYYCEASNQKETIKSQPAYLLPAEMDWSFVQGPTNMTVKKGENITVTCRPPYSSPAAQVSWFKNDQVLPTTAHAAWLPNGDLLFHSIQEQDSGSYFCRASNLHLKRFLTSRRAILTVLAPPSVKLWPQNLTVPVGARVVLECQVSGHPQPAVGWLKRGYSKQTGGKLSLGLRNATLYIQSARKYDEGLYVCVASNTLGQSQNASRLRVAASPIIVTLRAQVSCRIGASVILPCQAIGILPITYSWTRSQADTQAPTNRIEEKHVDDNGDLHISNVQHYHAGEYYCTAENRAGRHQRRFVLTVIDEHHPADKGMQARLGLSASTVTSKQLPISQSSDSEAEQLIKRIHEPHVQEQPKDACPLSPSDATTKRDTTYSSCSQEAKAELKVPSGSNGWLLEHDMNKPTTISSQSLVSQMQTPTYPLTPHQNVESAQLYTQLSVTTEPLLVSNSEQPQIHNQTSVVTSAVSGTTAQNQATRRLNVTLASSHTQVPHQVGGFQSSNHHAASLAGETSESFTKMISSQQLSKLPVGRPFAFLQLDSLTPTRSHLIETKTSLSESVTPSSSSDAKFNQTQPYQLFTKSQLYQYNQKPGSTHIYHTKLKNSGQPLLLITQSLSTVSQISQLVPKQSFTHSIRYERSTVQNDLPQSPTVTKALEIHSQHLTAIPNPTSTMSTFSQIQLQSSPTRHPLVSVANIHLELDQTPESSTLDPEIPGVHLVNMSHQEQLNPSKEVKSSNDTDRSDWPRKNTSQSPMSSNVPRVTQQSPSWLPVLEKHDIPIVVGVGVSLAFIFITVTFYSVIQKSEPALTNRAAQRNVDVPMRHTEHHDEGRTYENRAFENDDCMAVIEQSPNTSDIRTQPPGSNHVTVQLEPTSENFQEDSQPAPGSQSVTVETYPEPILDTKFQIEPSPGEETCSLSQPSIQLQCAEDWASNIGDNHGPCQDPFPCPSSLPSCSPSPSPPSRLGMGLRSSLTLHSAEPCAPIHHTLSISHGNPPLFLSHHVSLGLTTIAVDVHFYPESTPSTAVGSSTPINSASSSTANAAPFFSAPLDNNQETDNLAVRLHPTK